MKAKEIRELSAQEIAQKIKELRSELLNLRLRKQLGQVDKPHRFTKLRREVARMETILNQKEQVVA